MFTVRDCRTRVVKLVHLSPPVSVQNPLQEIVELCSALEMERARAARLRLSFGDCSKRR